MQLDTGEGENFVPPAGVVASQTERPTPAAERPDSQTHATTNDQADAEPGTET